MSEDSPPEDSPPEDQSIKQISPEKALGGCALGGCLVLLGGCLVLLVVYGMLTDSGKDTVQVESPETTGDKKLKNSVQGDSPEATVAKKIMNSIYDMEMILIPAGEFKMGTDKGQDDEKPVHTVKITKPFYLSATEVTQAQYEAVMGKNPSNFKGEDLPVEMVTWVDAVEFCHKLSTKENMPYRLPTEAEWEYACRAGTKTAYSFGVSEKDMGDYAWNLDNSDKKTHPVGKKKPNAWGLFDMHGNVWEWCSDWYGKYRHGIATDPAGHKPVMHQTGVHRVFRGGCFGNDSSQFRSTFRRHYDPGERTNNLGFRLALSVEVESPEATGDK